VAKFSKYPQCINDVRVYILAAVDFGLTDYKIEGFGDTLNKRVCLYIQNFGPT